MHVASISRRNASNVAWSRERGAARGAARRLVAAAGVLRERGHGGVDLVHRRVHRLLVLGRGAQLDAGVEAGEALLVATLRANHLEHVEAHRLRQRPALPRHDLVTDLDAEGGRDVHRRVLVALLETVVLLDVVQVVLTDDDGVLHLGGLDRASDQLATDVHVA